MIIDKKMNLVEVELNYFEYRNLQINSEEVKKYKSKRELNKRITDFLNENE